MAQTASFLCRDEDEVRQKAKELGLVEKHVRVILWNRYSHRVISRITTAAIPAPVKAAAPIAAQKKSPAGKRGKILAREEKASLVLGVN